MHDVYSLDGLVACALRDLLMSGRGWTSSPRGYETTEIYGWHAKIRDPRRRLPGNMKRDARLGYCAAKVTWDLNERDDPDSLLFWNPNGEWYIDDIRSDTGLPHVRRAFYGEAYGKRFMPQLRKQLEMLRADAHTRRAYVLVWKPEDAWEVQVKKNVPCCIGFSLRLRDAGMYGRVLDMQVDMRSQSVGVLPYDVFLFSVLQELIANELTARLGELYWHAHTMHVYETEISRRSAELSWYVDHGSRSERMAPIPYALDEAAHRWWKTMRDVRAGDQIAYEFDPLEELFVNGFPRNPVAA